MNTSESPDEVASNEDAVVHFLKSHPNFFVHHTELLEFITIPHGLGGDALSLLEYQARSLKQRVAELQQQQKCEQKVESLRRSITQSLQHVVGELLAANNISSLLEYLKDFLNNYYDAQWVKLFASAVNHNIQGMPPFVYPLPVELRGMFTLIFNNPKPLCDSLQHEHVLTLFGADVEKIHSTLLIPFQIGAEEALLAVGSSQRHCYRQSVELEILLSITEIVSGLSHPEIQLRTQT